MKLRFSPLDMWECMDIEEKEELVRQNEEEIFEIMKELNQNESRNVLQNLALTLQKQNAQELEFWLKFYGKI